MILKIFMLIFILLLLLTAGYMWQKKSSHFIIYDMSTHPELTTVLKYTSITLILESILGVIFLFFNNKYLNLITIAFASLTILIFGLIFSKKN